VTSGVGVVLIGSRLEQQIVAYIPSDARHAVLDLTGQTTLTEAAGAIAACDLLVGNDSAPIHLASGVGTPSLAVFGPTIREFGFVPRNAEIIALDRLWCRPCSPHGDRVCPVYTHECMGRIDAATVHHRVQELLKLRSSAEAIGA
jgi:heptosyltransferase II